MSKHVRKCLLLTWCLLSMLTVSWTQEVVTSNAGMPDTPTQSSDIQLPENAMAYVISMDGTVLYQRSDSTYWEQAVPTSQFYALDRIKTTSQSFCEIRYKEGHTLMIEPSTDVTLEGEDKKDGSWKNLKMKAGKIWFKIIKGTSMSKDFSLETPHASISVKGTLFSVFAPFGGISAFEGAVEVAQQGATQLVQKGFETSISQTGVLSSVQPLSAQSMQAFNSFAARSSLPPDMLNSIRDGLGQIGQAAGSAAGAGGAAAGTAGQAVAGAAALGAGVLGLGAALLPGGGSTTDVKETHENIATASTQSMKPTEDLVQQTPTKEIVVTSPVMTKVPTQNKKKSETLLTDVSAEIVSFKHFLLSNPAYLSVLKDDRVSSVVLVSDMSGGMLDFLGATEEDSYRYDISNPNNDPRKFNKGPNNNIIDLKSVGFTMLRKNVGFGVFLKNDQSARFYNTYVKAIQRRGLLLFGGLSLPIGDHLSIGVMAKGYIDSTTQQNTNYTILNSNRTTGTYEHGFEELIPSTQVVQDETIFDYTFNAGITFQPTDWWVLGAAMDNFFYSDTGSYTSSQFEQLTRFNTVIHFPDAMLRAEYVMPYTTENGALMIEGSLNTFRILNMGVVKLTASQYLSNQKEVLTYEASFRLWFLYMSAAQQEVTPGKDANFEKDKVYILSAKVNF